MDTLQRRVKQQSYSFFLFGPRGTGKTTWLKKHFPGALRVDLLKEQDFRKFLSSPEKLLDLINGDKSKKVIIIDEVQRVPELLNIVHHIMDGNNDLQFILTGSSSRKLKRSGVD